MSRFKLLLFALPALALWLADLSLTASSFSEKAEAQAAAYAVRGVDAVSVRVANRRSELQGLALRLGSAPGAWVTLDALKGNKAELAAERLGNLRRNASDAVSSALRRDLVLGVRTDNGAVFVRGAEPPASTLSGLETDAVAGAGSDGQTRDAFGKSYLFFSFPLLGSDKEARAQGLLIVGGPLLPDGTADQVALETGLSALGVVQAGKLVSSGGVTSNGQAARCAPRNAGGKERRGDAGQRRRAGIPQAAALHLRARPRTAGQRAPRVARTAPGAPGAGQHRAGDGRPGRHPAVCPGGHAAAPGGARRPLGLDGARGPGVPRSVAG
jgi:hypothetical protein